MLIKIKPHNIGWLTLEIFNKTFEVSFLSDFKQEMDNLLDFKSGDLSTKVNRIYLDGEGEDLYLTTWVNLDDLYIVWEHYKDGVDVDIEIFTVNYEYFKNLYYEKFEKIKDEYYKTFDLNNVIHNQN